MTPILEARGLIKHFGRTQALAGLDLEVSPGRVVALLGPNGAGKTTFVRAVATLLRPDAGTLHVAGIDALRQPARVRQVIGLAGQFAAFEWVFITIGLVAGNAQAAQGISVLVLPLTFVSSAYVPVSSMQGWMQPFAEHQPLTPIVNAVRGLAGGPQVEALLDHTTAYYVGLSLIWTAAIVIVFGLVAAVRFSRR
jgi:ABC transporter/ABC-2 type transporter